MPEHRARSGRRLASTVPYGRRLACECVGGSCEPFTVFSREAGDFMAEAMEAGSDRDVLAVAGNFRRPLGSVSRGTLRARSTARGLEVEIDLPAGTVADEIVAANETAGVVIRPLIDFARSTFTDTARGREYARPHVRAFIVGATDTKEGWPEVTVDYDVVEGRSSVRGDESDRLEIRSELRFDDGGDGRSPGTLSGTIVTYGDEATITREGRRERFAALSCYLSPAISLNIQHDRSRVLVDRLGDSFAINDGPDALRVRVELPSTELGREAAADVRGGRLGGWSSEFRALEEKDERGVRVITSAVLEGIGLVDSPAYKNSSVEIRKRIAEGRRFWL